MAIVIETNSAAMILLSKCDKTFKLILQCTNFLACVHFVLDFMLYVFLVIKIFRHVFPGYLFKSSLSLKKVQTQILHHLYNLVLLFIPNLTFLTDEIFQEKILFEHNFSLRLPHDVLNIIMANISTRFILKIRTLTMV